ncbi:MAG: hypothetical protein L0241_00460 [Planctomycetia bacterium]|nr:hypothetical protein [Planctomycetia bacterium]
MPARYQCPACQVLLTLVNPPGPKFECPKCDRWVTLIAVGSASAQTVKSPAPPSVPTSRPVGSKPAPMPKSAAPAVEVFDLPELPAKATPTAPRPIPQRATRGQPIPEDLPEDLPDDSQPSLWADKRVQVGAIMGGAVLVVAILLVAVSAFRKPSEPVEQAQTTTPSVTPTTPTPPTTTPPTTSPTTPPKTPSTTVPPKTPTTPPNPTPPNTTPSTENPLPKPKENPPPPPKPPEIDYSKLDQFGNPIGQNQGLAKQNEFTGQRLLFWSPHTGGGDMFFALKNPMWKALQEKGFVVRREFGQFKQAWLKEIDQLWILSTAPEPQLRAQRSLGISPEMIAKQLRELSPDLFDQVIKEAGSKIPAGWTRDDMITMTVADYALGVSPAFHLTARDYDSIVDFVKNGKGLCLLADNDPFTTEANELARRLFGVGVSGNYGGEKIAYVRERKLTPADIRKYKGDYEVDDHHLLTGVNFVYEGVTISTVPKSDKLDVVLKASDGKPVVVVSKEQGRRVIIDCGFTRYCHGPNDRVSYIMMTAGTVRLAQNFAAYLAGKDPPKKP